MLHRVQNSNARLLRTMEWKKRPPAWFPKKETQGGESLEKEPKRYSRQVTQLEHDLERVIASKSLFTLNPNLLLELGLLTGERQFSDELAMAFSERWHLEFKDFHPVNNGWGVCFFRIIDFDQFISAITSDLAQFTDFSEETLEKGDFNFKRVSLIRYLRFRTAELKDSVTPYLTVSRKVHLKIDLADSIPEFEDILSKTAFEVGLDIYISRNGAIELEDVHDKGIRSFSEFAAKIARFDQVTSIYLDEYVSRIGNPAEPLPPSALAVDIASIGANAPVVAVIDTGVARNTLTDPFLTSEGLDFTGSGDPFLDVSGHGTSIACEIAYGSTLRKFFLDNQADQLIPVAKIFPVKVIGSTDDEVINYEEIFSLTGPLAAAVREHSIKFINFSITTTVPKLFNDAGFSKHAYFLDAFSKALDVLIVVCAGNVSSNELNELGRTYRDLTFFGRPESITSICSYTSSRSENLLNICPPADFLSGLTVGSAYKQKNRFVASSFSKSFHIPQSSFRKPELITEAGGDVQFDMSLPMPFFSESHSRVPVATPDETHLSLAYGTSLSAPRVVRALVISKLQYPSFRLHTHKGLLLHKVNSFQFTHKKRGFSFANGSLTEDKIDFHPAYGGQGVMPEMEEDELFSDDDFEITSVIEDTVSNLEAKTFLLPIARLIGNGTESQTHDNLIQLKLSVCYPPSLSEDYVNDIDRANTVHVAAFLHKVGYNPLHVLERNEKKYPERFHPREHPEYQNNVLLDWTNDYQGFNGPFSIESNRFLKDSLLEFLGDDDHIAITVRGYSDVEFLDHPFAAFLSMRDLGEVADIRGQIDVSV